jgi:hypothetical protein
MQKSNQTSRTSARLANIAASSAPAPLVRAATALRDVLTRDGCAMGHERELEEAQDALGEAIADETGSVALRLDLFGVLGGGDAQLAGHRRPNVASALRAKRRALGRDPVWADFPAGHAVPLLALAYWGGVESWARGASSRSQRPKGYWSVRANQIAEIRRFSSLHPGLPLTAATLGRNGLAGIARRLAAEELEALCREAGCDRRLRRRANAWWTVDQVIDAYAGFCRAQGATLSAHALMLIGGEASSLRAYARRHFPTFRALQQATRARHPELRLPTRPTASDGTVLDSWSEVVVYQAIRRALPDVAIEHHVALPGEDRRSADFVVGGRVWVEVLGIATADMPATRSGRQRKYAAQWAAKSACYAALWIAPVLIEPAEVHDPVRLGAKVEEIAASLGETPREPPPPVGRTTRGKGFWDFDALCDAVRRVAAGTGVFPTYAALTAAGFGHAASLLRRPGARTRVAAVLGLTCRTARGAWTRERVVAELSDCAAAHAAYPTRRELVRQGRGALASAATRLWAGAELELRAAVEAKVVVPLPQRRAANGSCATMAQIEAALRPLAVHLGRMPTGAAAAAAGLATAWAHASRRKGVAAVAASLGVPCGALRRPSREEMIDAFAHHSESRGSARLTTTLIRKELGSGGVARVRRLGGMAAVRAAIERERKGGGGLGKGRQILQREQVAVETDSRRGAAPLRPQHPARGSRKSAETERRPGRWSNRVRVVAHAATPLPTLEIHSLARLDLQPRFLLRRRRLD